MYSCTMLPTGYYHGTQHCARRPSFSLAVMWTDHCKISRGGTGTRTGGKHQANYKNVILFRPECAMQCIAYHHTTIEHGMPCLQKVKISTVSDSSRRHMRETTELSIQWYSSWSPCWSLPGPLRISVWGLRQLGEPWRGSAPLWTTSASWLQLSMGYVCSYGNSSNDLWGFCWEQHVIFNPIFYACGPVSIWRPHAVDSPPSRCGLALLDEG